MKFTNLDYAIFAIIFFSVLIAFVRGFVASLLSLIGWIASIFLSYLMYPAIEPAITSKISSQIVAMVVGHVGLLIIFLIVFGIANIIINSVLSPLTGIIDKFFGAAFGFIRGALIVSFFFLIAYTTVGVFQGVDSNKDINDESLPKWLTTSESFPYLKDGSLVISSFIPDTLYERFKGAYSDFSQKKSDDRFQEFAIRNLQESLKPAVVENIKNNIDKQSSKILEEEVKEELLRDLLNAYLNKENRRSDKEIDQKTLEKIKVLLTE